MTKKNRAIKMMQSPGATGEELMRALKWQAHLVRGLISNVGRLDKVRVRRIEKANAPRITSNPPRNRRTARQWFPSWRTVPGGMSNAPSGAERAWRGNENSLQISSFDA